MEGLRAALPLLRSGGFSVVVLCTAVHADPHLPPYDHSADPSAAAGAAGAGGGGGDSEAPLRLMTY